MSNRRTKLDFFKGEFKAVLRGTPFDEEGRALLNSYNIPINEDNFFDEDSGLYLDLSDFLEEDAKNEVSRYHEEIHASLEFTTQSNEVTSRHTRHEEYLRNLSDKKDFEESVEKTLFPTLLITGYAGAGKTTYLHYLKNTYGDNKSKKSNKGLSFHVIDLATPQKRIPFLGAGMIDFTAQLNKNRSVWSLIIRLTEYLSELIANEFKYGLKHNNKLELVDLLGGIIPLYKKWSSEAILQSTEAEEFFTILVEGAEGSNSKGLDLLSNDLANYLKDNVFNKSKEEALSLIFQIIICTLISLSRKDNRRYICAIDDIEFLLDAQEKTVVNEKDLDTILDALIEADRLFTYIKKHLKGGNANCYAFLMVMRPTTYDFGDTSQGRVFNKNINTAQAVGHEAVMLKRFSKTDEIFESHELYKDNEYIEFFKAVIEDATQSPWCMHTIINNLCNDNYRQIVIQLIDIISKKRLSEISFFLGNWKCANRPETKDLVENQRLRFLLRKNFLNSLLHHYEAPFDKREDESGFFTKIFPVSVRGFELESRFIENPEIFDMEVIYNRESFYTRKILNIVSNYKRVCDGDICLSDLFIVLRENYIDRYLSGSNRSIFKPFTDFCKIMKMLSDATYEVVKEGNEAFGRCIDLSIKSLRFTEDSIKDALYKEIKVRESRKSRYKEMSKVTLTPAGEEFCHILPDFEMLAARFLYGNSSLFSYDSFCNMETGGENVYKFEKIACFIRDKAFEMINNYLINDFLNFQYNDDPESLYGISQADNPSYNPASRRRGEIRYDYTNNAIRILKSHAGYLSNFILNLQYRKDENGNNAYDCSEAINKLKEVYYSYIDFLDDLTSGKYIVYSCPYNNSSKALLDKAKCTFFIESGKGKRKIFLIGKQNPCPSVKWADVIEFDYMNFFRGYRFNRQKWDI